MSEQEQIVKEIFDLLKRASKAGIKVGTTAGLGEPIWLSLAGSKWSAVTTIRLEWEPE